MAAEVYYSKTVARLLKAGSVLKEINWRDYPQRYNLNEIHIPELIQMATDQETFEEESGSAMWANIHAWRALGQLHARAAIQPLIGILFWIEDYDDDWSQSDLPEVFALIGPSSLQPLTTYLSDPENKLWARAAAADGLGRIGARYPEERDRCVKGIAATLENYSSNDDMLNAALISFLADLKAVEAAPIVEKAFKAEKVEEFFVGDWEDYQVAVGLLPARLTEPEFAWLHPDTELWGEDEDAVRRLNSSDEKKNKNKRRQEKKSRKQNRKKHK